MYSKICVSITYYFFTITNISIMKKGSKTFGQRVEVKNLNSIRSVQRSIDYEILRHAELLEKKESVSVETRTFDAPSGKTIAMRKKEAAHDYRYFPEPDLNPIKIEASFIKKTKESMPPLPNELYKKFTNEYQLSSYDALVIIEQKEIALYYEEVVSYTNNYKSAANWVMGGIKSFLNQQAINIASFELSAKKIAQLIKLIDDNQISHSVASQKVFPEMIKSPNLEPKHIAKKKQLD